MEKCILLKQYRIQILANRFGESKSSPECSPKPGFSPHIFMSFLVQACC